MKHLEFDGCFNPAPRPNRPRYCPGHPTWLQAAPHGSTGLQAAPPRQGPFHIFLAQAAKVHAWHELRPPSLGLGGLRQLSCLQGHPCQMRPCPPPHQNQPCTNKRLRSPEKTSELGGSGPNPSVPINLHLRAITGFLLPTISDWNSYQDCS